MLLKRKKLDKVKEIIRELEGECEECCGITCYRERVLELLNELKSELDL